MLRCENHLNLGVKFIKWCSNVRRGSREGLIKRGIGQERVNRVIGQEKVKRGIKVKSSMARSHPVKNLLPQNVGSIINYLQ